MKKLLVLALVVIVILSFGVAAHAAIKVFYGFSIDVPTGWTEYVDEGDYSVSITAPDGSESLKIKHVSREATNAFTFAQSSAYELNGNSPVEIGYGEFEFVLPDGTNVRARHVDIWGVLMKSRSNFDRLTTILSTWNY